jgi:hypothetical protein
MKIIIDPDLREENVAHQFIKQSLKFMIQRSGLLINQTDTLENGLAQYYNNENTELDIKKTDKVYLEKEINILGKKIIPDIIVFNEKKEIEIIIEVVDSGPPSFEKMMAYAEAKINIVFISAELPVKKFNLEKGEYQRKIYFRSNQKNLMLLKSQSPLSRFKILSKVIKFDLNEYLDWNVGYFLDGPKGPFLFKNEDDKIIFNSRTFYNSRKDDFSKDSSKKIPKYLDVLCKTFSKTLKFKEESYFNKSWNKHYVKIETTRIMDNLKYPNLFVVGEVSEVKSFCLDLKNLLNQKIGLTLPRKYVKYNEDSIDLRSKEKDYESFNNIMNQVKMGSIYPLWFQVNPIITKSNKGIKVEGLWRCFYGQSNYDDTYKKPKKIKYFTMKEVINEVEQKV